MMAFTAFASLQATNLFWNPGGTGGDGIWGTGPGNNNWNLVPGALAGNTGWQDGIDDVAVFQDATGGIVTVFDTIQTAGIIQNGANYTINAGNITLAPDSALNAPFVNVQAGMLTIDAQFAGSAGLLKTGGGTLTLTAANPYTGLTAIQGGTVNLAGSLASTNISISSGATLLDQNGGFSGSTTLTNAGSLTLNADDTVASYISNGGILTNGPGTLFTTSAALNDGSSVAGLLNAGTLNSNGAVLISGTATAGSAGIQSGVLTLSGTLVSDTVGIFGGASLLNQNGGLSNSATLTNAGSLTLNANDTITSYISNGGTIAAGPGTLFTTSAALNDGSSIVGLLNTSTLTSNGVVSISGTATAGSASIQSGTLTLGGTLASDTVVISGGASLLDQNGGLSGSATLTNAGSLTLNANDTITSYISNGGTITAGPGTLFTTSAALNDGSSVAGLLNAGTLTSNGTVQVTGNISAGSINIATGTLTNTGTLGNASTLLNINEGATLLAGGIQQYSLLATSGAGPGTWLGNLENPSTIAPGGLGAAGILAITGNFTQLPASTLKLDLAATDNDLLDITGSATFDGALELNQLGSTAIAPFVPVTVVSASGYSGNITSLDENLDGAVWFNPGNGTVIRIEFPSGGDSFFGSTRNQTSTWISLYDDVIDPGITNITSGPGGYDISSGIADAGNPDLLWALFASFTPTGLNAELLNRLSPEVYGGLSDYAMQATRAHQRSALSAPALDPRDHSKGGMGSSAKGGAKGGFADKAAPLDWEFFAAVDYFHAGTDNSNNQADYDFDGMGVLAGARTRPWDQAQLAVYLGADSGSIDGELIDADAFGWNCGVIGEYLLHEKSRTRLTTGISYGSYLFDGNRGSASATAAGWAPGNADFDDVDVDAFDLFIGVDGVAWKQDALTLIPSAGLRYAMTTMDSFSESTGGAPGSPIALEVNRDRHESLLLELGLLAQVEVNPKLSLWGEGGVNIGLLGDGRVLAASFAKGSRDMRAEADGLDDDSLYLGCGAVYRITDNIQAAIGYRADVRSGAETQQELRLSSSWRF